MTNEMTQVKLFDAEKKPYIHTVEELSIFQLAKTLSTFKEIMGLAKSNTSVAELVDMAFAAFDEEGKKNKEADGPALSDPIDAFQILLSEVPEQAQKLLSIMSGIDRETLERQKGVVIFDVYNAILTANDMKEFIERAKKSLEVTRAAFNVDLFKGKKKA